MNLFHLVPLSAGAFLGAALVACSAHAEPAHDSSPALPAVETLGVGSDFTAFVAPGVPAELQSLALRRLWHVLDWKSDGLGTYEGDYRHASPTPPQLGLAGVERFQRR